MTEEERYELNMLRRSQELLHEELDWIGVPRCGPSGEGKWTVYARVKWLNEWVPNLWTQVKDAKEVWQKWDQR